jgi:hypothetical protein
LTPTGVLEAGENVTGATAFETAIDPRATDADNAGVVEVERADV